MAADGAGLAVPSPARGRYQPSDHTHTHTNTHTHTHTHTHTGRAKGISTPKKTRVLWDMGSTEFMALTLGGRGGGQGERFRKRERALGYFGGLRSRGGVIKTSPAPHAEGIAEGPKCIFSSSLICTTVAPDSGKVQYEFKASNKKIWPQSVGWPYLPLGLSRGPQPRTRRV